MIKVTENNNIDFYHLFNSYLILKQKSSLAVNNFIQSYKLLFELIQIFYYEKKSARSSQLFTADEFMQANKILINFKNIFNSTNNKKLNILYFFMKKNLYLRNKQNSIVKTTA